MLPYNTFGLIRWLNRVAVSMIGRRALRANSTRNPILVTTVPNASDFVGVLGESLVVYYCVDDFAEWVGLEKETVQRMERDLISKTDVFVATSDRLFKRLAQSLKPTYLLPHGVDLELFASEVSVEHSCLANVPAPRVGYFGLFDERSDQKLIAELATCLPDCSFVFTGPVVVDTSYLSKLPNVFFTGQVKYRDLPALARGFDVLFIPYVCNSLTESISPLKLKEYLATGKPVVSTPLAEVRKFEGYVLTAASVSGLRAAILSALSDGTEGRQGKVMSLLEKEDWQSKAKQFIAICNANLAAVSRRSATDEDGRRDQ
jgi:glycosyltransferase involved in cell wall biosynthesis